MTDIINVSSGSPEIVVVGVGQGGAVGPAGPVGQTGNTGPTGLVGVAFQGSAPSITQLWADTSTVSAQVGVFDGGTPSTQLTSIRMRRGTTEQWASNPILDAGEFGYNSSLNQFKIGDGVKTWSLLPYVTAEANLNNVRVTGETFTMTGVTVVNGTIDGGQA